MSTENVNFGRHGKAFQEGLGNSILHHPDDVDGRMVGDFDIMNVQFRKLLSYT